MLPFVSLAVDAHDVKGRSRKPTRLLVSNSSTAFYLIGLIDELGVCPLDGDLAMGKRIIGAVHRAHAAAADFLAHVLGPR